MCAYILPTACAELGSAREVLRDSLCDKRPKTGAVIERLEMTQLMYNEIILEMRRQVDDFVMKVEILFLRAASPPCAHIFYRNTAI